MWGAHAWNYCIACTLQARQHQTPGQHLIVPKGDHGQQASSVKTYFDEENFMRSKGPL